MLLMNESVLSLKEKTFYFPTLKFPASTKNLLWPTDQLNIILDDFGIYNDTYAIGLSSVIYIFNKDISTLWLWSTDEYVRYFEGENSIQQVLNCIFLVKTL